MQRVSIKHAKPFFSLSYRCIVASDGHDCCSGGQSVTTCPFVTIFSSSPPCDISLTASTRGFLGRPSGYTLLLPPRFRKFSLLLQQSKAGKICSIATGCCFENLLSKIYFTRDNNRRFRVK